MFRVRHQDWLAVVVGIWERVWRKKHERDERRAVVRKAWVLVAVSQALLKGEMVVSTPNGEGYVRKVRGSRVR